MRVPVWSMRTPRSTPVPAATAFACVRSVTPLVNAVDSPARATGVDAPTSRASRTGSTTTWAGSGPNFEQSRRILAGHGTLYLHVDPRESHYCKVLLDEIFGRECFLNEVIWAYDYGARTTSRWPAKHDVILVYARSAGSHHFDLAEVERVPYMAPGLQTRERAARGKTPTDVWWHTIVPTNSRERTGYPAQKPAAILRRIVAASSRPEDLVVDWCAGSGTTGVAAHELGRRFLLCDSSPEAIAVMRQRLGDSVPVVDMTIG